MNAASDSIRIENLCSRVDEFLVRVSHLMLLTDSDIPDEDFVTRSHHEALTIKAELMPQRNMECAKRLLLIDEFIKKTALDCPHLEWAANYIRRTNPDLEEGMLMHGVILNSSNVAIQGSRKGKRNYQSENRPDLSRKKLLRRMEKNSNALVEISQIVDRKYASTHPRSYRRVTVTGNAPPQQAISEAQEAIAADLRIQIAAKMKELLPLVKTLSELVPFKVDPHLTTSFTMLSANMRNQTASISKNTHENQYLEELFHAMYPKTTEYAKVDHRRSSHSSTKSIQNPILNTQQLEDGYKAIAANFSSRWTIGDPRLLLFENEDEDFNNDSIHSSESDSNTGTEDDASDLDSGDLELAN
jgi:hypothetical protein